MFPSQDARWIECAHLLTFPGSHFATVSKNNRQLVTGKQITGRDHRYGRILWQSVVPTAADATGSGAAPLLTSSCRGLYTLERCDVSDEVLSKTDITLDGHGHAVVPVVDDITCSITVCNRRKTLGHLMTNQPSQNTLPLRFLLLVSCARMNCERELNKPVYTRN